MNHRLKNRNLQRRSSTVLWLICTSRCRPSILVKWRVYLTASTVVSWSARALIPSTTTLVVLKRAWLWRWASTIVPESTLGIGIVVRARVSLVNTLIIASRAIVTVTTVLLVSRRNYHILLARASKTYVIGLSNHLVVSLWHFNIATRIVWLMWPRWVVVNLWAGVLPRQVTTLNIVTTRISLRWRATKLVSVELILVRLWIMNVIRIIITVHSMRAHRVWFTCFSLILNVRSLFVGSSRRFTTVALTLHARLSIGVSSVSRNFQRLASLSDILWCATRFKFEIGLSLTTSYGERRCLIFWIFKSTHSKLFSRRTQQRWRNTFTCTLLSLAQRCESLVISWQLIIRAHKVRAWAIILGNLHIWTAICLQFLWLYRIQIFLKGGMLLVLIMRFQCMTLH